MGLRIAGTGAGIPKRSVSNNRLSEFLDTSDEWIISKTGIKSRYVCTDETLTQLCKEAAVQALESSCLRAGELGLIICSTIAGDYRTPSLACCVAESIGAESDSTRGEGGSGGALALAVADEVWMLENAVYSVISPEGCASILWKDATKVGEASECLKLTAPDLLELGVIERVIPETESLFDDLRKLLADTLQKSMALPVEELTALRYGKFRRLGVVKD